MNRYEEKQEKKRDRYNELAGKAEKKSTEHYEASNKISDFIPLGQPILVGHHSEGKHRRDIERINNNMRKSIAEDDKAKYYADKAASVGTGGISSDDPEAIQKLENKLENVVYSRDLAKEVNAEYRKAKKDIQKMNGISENLKKQLEKEKAAYCMGAERWKPHETYSLSYYGAEIRRLKNRIAALKVAAQATEAEPIEGDGFTITESKEANRIIFEFDNKPSKEVCQIMRKCGWRYSPTYTAWLRYLNNATRSCLGYTIKQVRELL